MCGFFVTNDSSISEEDFKIVDKRLSFRGPDFQSGLVKHCGWSLYHSRLSIIATNPKYSQPFFTPSGGVLVFNGEILNFSSLAKTFDIVNAESDTEVLASLLEKKSFDFNMLEGFFSFVYIDRFGSLRNVARDKFGVKPLVYFNIKDTISISSEASILSDLYKLDYNKLALEEYKVFRGPIFSGSYFNNVQSVTPGSCLVTGQYFDSTSKIAQSYKKIDELMPALKEEISNSVESRLVSDVPVGLLFSSGIDSNLINRSSNEVFQCFTGGFHGDYDLDFAKNLSLKEVNTFTIDKDDFIERFKNMKELRKEPISLPNEVVLSILAEKWRDMGGRVLLSGEAADEFFAGYDNIYFWALRNKSFTVEEFLDRYAYVSSEKVCEDIKESLKEFFSTLRGLSSFEKVRQFFVKKHLPLLFRRLDFSLMYSGIEGREPLASSGMYDLAMNFNPKDLFFKSRGKFPLRKIASDYFDDEFAYREKVGFPIDVKKIFTGVSSKDRLDNYSVWSKENLKDII